MQSFVIIIIINNLEHGAIFWEQEQKFEYALMIILSIILRSALER